MPKLSVDRPMPVAIEVCYSDNVSHRLGRLDVYAYLPVLTQRGGCRGHRLIASGGHDLHLGCSHFRHLLYKSRR